MDAVKRRVAVVCIAIVALAMGQGVAHATPGSGGAARLATAGIDSAQLAPGWELVGDELVWDGGAVRASIVPMGIGECDSGYTCVWEHINFNGRILQFRAAGLRSDMHDYTFDDKMSSWYNRNSRDARWYNEPNGGGVSRCMNNGSRNANLGIGSPFDDGDKMSSLRIYSNSTSC